MKVLLIKPMEHPQVVDIENSLKEFYRILDWLSDVRIPRDTGDFRLMSRRAVSMLNAMPERYRYVRGMVSWMGLRQEAIPYSRAARFSGETKYPLRKMISFAVDAVTGSGGGAPRKKPAKAEAQKPAPRQGSLF